MTTYISILRGINVSGQRMIKMDALKKMYETLGMKQVKTYIQSGNVIFQTENSTPRELQDIISNQIFQTFNHEVPVIVLTVGTLEHIIENNPFKNDSSKDVVFLHITFLAAPPVNVKFETPENKKAEGEELVLTDQAVYLFCPHGYGKTKLTNGFIENKLHVRATTRNWKTANELLKIARQF